MQIITGMIQNSGTIQWLNAVWLLLSYKNPIWMPYLNLRFMLGQLWSRCLKVVPKLGTVVVKLGVCLCIYLCLGSLFLPIAIADSIPESIQSAASANLSRSSNPPDIQRILDRGTLKVVLLNQENSPFFMMHGGALEGLDITLAKAIATQLGVKLELMPTATTFDEAVDTVYKLDADLALSKVSRTLKRARLVRFSQPYLRMRQGLLVNRVQITQQTNGRDMTEVIRDLTGTIGVIQGSSYVGFAKQKFPKTKVIEFTDWADLVNAVMQGKVLAAYRDELEVKKVIRTQPGSALQFQTIALTDTEDAIAAVLPWDSEHLLAFVNQYLDSNKINYTADTVLEDYADYFKKSG